MKRKQELSSVEKKLIDFHVKDLLARLGRITDEELQFIADDVGQPLALVKSYFEHTAPQIEQINQPAQPKKELTHTQRTIRNLMNQPTAGGKGTVTIASEASSAMIEGSVHQGNSTGINRNERNIFRGNK